MAKTMFDAGLMTSSEAWRTIRSLRADPPLRENNRNRTRPEFYGDGTLRFQAIAEVDFGEASAADLTDLLDCTLSYLASRQPTGSSA